MTTPPVCRKTVDPTGWLLCDGSAISRASYAALFTATGTVHGSGDGASTFNLPDYRGRFLRGVDNGAGRDTDSRSPAQPGGNASGVGTVQEDALQLHTHNLAGAAAAYYPGADDALGGAYATRVSGSQVTATLGPIGANSSTETRPKNAYVNYIIKY
jgi:microcystin-dependent protein